MEGNAEGKARRHAMAFFLLLRVQAHNASVMGGMVRGLGWGQDLDWQRINRW